ncbi:hypothetical protein HDU91_004817 [Kappamyces sp. JEL0680]|nr:hypothetical protein HDU91_004817 [Kappamyces sp. JEL0680]
MLSLAESIELHFIDSLGLFNQILFLKSEALCQLGYLNDALALLNVISRNTSSRKKPEEAVVELLYDDAVYPFSLGQFQTIKQLMSLSVSEKSRSLLPPLFCNDFDFTRIRIVLSLFEWADKNQHCTFLNGAAQDAAGSKTEPDRDYLKWFNEILDLIRANLARIIAALQAAIKSQTLPPFGSHTLKDWEASGLLQVHLAQASDLYARTLFAKKLCKDALTCQNQDEGSVYLNNFLTCKLGRYFLIGNRKLIARCYLAVGENDIAYRVLDETGMVQDQWKSTLLSTSLLLLKVQALQPGHTENFDEKRKAATEQLVARLGVLPQHPFGLLQISQIYDALIDPVDCRNIAPNIDLKTLSSYSRLAYEFGISANKTYYASSEVSTFVQFSEEMLIRQSRFMRIETQLETNISKKKELHSQVLGLSKGGFKVHKRYLQHLACVTGMHLAKRRRAIPELMPLVTELGRNYLTEYLELSRGVEMVNQPAVQQIYLIIAAMDAENGRNVFAMLMEALGTAVFVQTEPANTSLALSAADIRPQIVHEIEDCRREDFIGAGAVLDLMAIDGAVQDKKTDSTLTHNDIIKYKKYLERELVVWGGSPRGDRYLSLSFRLELLYRFLKEKYPQDYFPFSITSGNHQVGVASAWLDCGDRQQDQPTDLLDHAMTIVEKHDIPTLEKVVEQKISFKSSRGATKRKPAPFKTQTITVVAKIDASVWRSQRPAAPLGDDSKTSDSGPAAADAPEAGETSNEGPDEEPVARKRQSQSDLLVAETYSATFFPAAASSADAATVDFQLQRTIPVLVVDVISYATQRVLNCLKNYKQTKGTTFLSEGQEFWAIATDLLHRVFSTQNKAHTKAGQAQQKRLKEERKRIKAEEERKKRLQSPGGQRKRKESMEFKRMDLSPKKRAKVSNDPDQPYYEPEWNHSTGRVLQSGDHSSFTQKPPPDLVVRKKEIAPEPVSYTSAYEAEYASNSIEFSLFPTMRLTDSVDRILDGLLEASKSFPLVPIFDPYSEMMEVSASPMVSTVAAESNMALVADHPALAVLASSLPWPCNAFYGTSAPFAANAKQYGFYATHGVPAYSYIGEIKGTVGLCRNLDQKREFLSHTPIYSADAAQSGPLEEAKVKIEKDDAADSLAPMDSDQRIPQSSEPGADQIAQPPVYEIGPKNLLPPFCFPFPVDPSLSPNTLRHLVLDAREYGDFDGRFVRSCCSSNGANAVLRTVVIINDSDVGDRLKLGKASEVDPEVKEAVLTRTQRLKLAIFSTKAIRADEEIVVAAGPSFFMFPCACDRQNGCVVEETVKKNEIYRGKRCCLMPRPDPEAQHEAYFDLLQAHESYRQFVLQGLQEEIRLVPSLWNYKCGKIPMAVEESDAESEASEESQPTILVGEPKTEEPEDGTAQHPHPVVEMTKEPAPATLEKEQPKKINFLEFMKQQSVVLPSSTSSSMQEISDGSELVSHSIPDPVAQTAAESMPAPNSDIPPVEEPLEQPRARISLDSASLRSFAETMTAAPTVIPDPTPVLVSTKSLPNTPLLESVQLYDSAGPPFGREREASISDSVRTTFTGMPMAARKSEGPSMELPRGWRDDRIPRERRESEPPYPLYSRSGTGTPPERSYSSSGHRESFPPPISRSGSRDHRGPEWLGDRQDGPIQSPTLSARPFTPRFRDEPPPVSGPPRRDWYPPRGRERGGYGDGRYESRPAYLPGRDGPPYERPYPPSGPESRYPPPDRDRGEASAAGDEAVSANKLSKQKLSKRLTLDLIESCGDWKTYWMELTDSIEQNQLCAAHWVQDEVEETGCVFVEAFKDMSITTTELFIESRTFLEALELYRNYLTEILGKQQEIYEDKKILVKTQHRIAEISRRDPRVAPVADDGEFDETEGEMSLLHKKLASYQKIIRDNYLRLQQSKNALLAVYLYEFTCRLEHLMNRFSEIFHELKSKAESQEFKESALELSKQAIQKHTTTAKAAYHDNRTKELVKWIKCSRKCMYTWDKVRDSQINHCWILFKWLSHTESIGGSTASLDSQKDSKIKPIVLEWLSLTDPQYQLHGAEAAVSLSPTKPVVSAEIYETVKSVFDSQTKVLSQIQGRELDLKAAIEEMQLVQLKAPGGKASVTFDKALHRVSAIMQDNRRFRITKLADLQETHWGQLERSCGTISGLYFKISMKFLGIVQEMSNANSKMQSDHASQMSVSEKSIVEEPELESGLVQSPVTVQERRSSLIASLHSNPSGLKKGRGSTLKEIVALSLNESDSLHDSIPSISVSPSIDEFKTELLSDPSDIQPDLLNPTIKKSKRAVVQPIMSPSSPQKYSSGRRQSLPVQELFAARVQKPPPPIPQTGPLRSSLQNLARE